MVLTGRTQIFSDYSEVSDENICSILSDAMSVHEKNRAEIIYLYNYYKGKQPVLNKSKLVRPEINNILLCNRASEIVNFKVGYLLGEPIQYVSRNSSDVNDAINSLNDFVFAEDKASKDKELAEWFSICGTSYRLVLPDPDDEEDESPFEIYTLDPRCTFVVYENSIEQKPILGVTYIIDKNEHKKFTCYSKDHIYYVEYNPKTDKYTMAYKDESVESEEHLLGGVPIIEYPANSVRMGVFETVITILDSINQVESDRIDAVDNFVDAIMVFKGVDIISEDYKALKEEGALRVPIDGDVKYLVQELNQQATQTLVDNMYQSVLSIVGMPSMSDGSTSDSSNNGAVLLRNGWQSAESRAKDSELIFKKSEKLFLRIALEIARSYQRLELKLKDIDIRFTRRNYENLLVKAQVLTTMLGNEKIHPRLAFEHSGLFIDPELAYTISAEYEKEREEKQNAELEAFKGEQNRQDIINTNRSVISKLDEKEEE